MTEYEKLTFDRFKARLKEGVYTNLAGARRGIGKSKGWTEQDKEAAQALALKHFGGTAAKTATKATKKAPKAAKKSTAKAASKKTAKTVAETPEVSKPKAAPQRKSLTRVTDALSAAPLTTGQHTMTASEAIVLAQAARKEFEFYQSNGMDVSAYYPDAVKLVHTAVQHMSHALNGLPQPGGTIVAAVAPRIALPVPPPPQSSKTVAEVEDNGRGDDADLTPQERAQKQVLMRSEAAQALAGLPRPV